MPKQKLTCIEEAAMEFEMKIECSIWGDKNGSAVQTLK